MLSAEHHLSIDNIEVLMNLLKKKAILAIIAYAIFALSSTAYAKATGEEKVTSAIENTIKKIELALSLAEKGSDKEPIVKAINDARQLQKEFRYEVTERQRDRENNKLRVARDQFQKGEVQPAEATLREALAGFNEMKSIYDSKH
jgi:large subunit ribosomal protein L7/L12